MDPPIHSLSLASANAWYRRGDGVRGDDEAEAIITHNLEDVRALSIRGCSHIASLAMHSMRRVVHASVP